MHRKAGRREPTIDTAFGEFLIEESRRLKPRTYRDYENVIDWYRCYLNEYGYRFLDDQEESLFNRLASQGFSFCDIFSPKLATAILDDFLLGFMVTEVYASRLLIKTTVRILKRLLSWLAQNGYIDKELADAAKITALRGRDVLADVVELRDCLFEMAEQNMDLTPGHSIKDGFYVAMVTTGRIALRAFSNNTSYIINVPQKASDLCRPGFLVFLTLGLVNGEWKVLEADSPDPGALLS